MPNCSVIGCCTKSGKRPNVTLHRLPKNEIKNKKWLEIIGIKNLNVSTKSIYICSLHFEESSLNRTLNITTLRDDAIPSHNLLPTARSSNSGILTEKLFQPSSFTEPLAILSTSDILTEKTQDQPLSATDMSCNKSTSSNIESATTAQDTKDLLQMICRTCYSSDRNLYHLEKHTLLVTYKQLIGDIKVDIGPCCCVCWECCARLRSFARFREKAIQANFHLLMTQNHDHTYPSKLPPEQITNKLQSSLQVKIFEANHSDINCVDSESDPSDHEYDKDMVKTEAEDINCVDSESDPSDHEYDKDMVKTEAEDINCVDSESNPSDHEYDKDMVKTEAQDVSDYNYTPSYDETEQTEDKTERTIGTMKDNILEELTNNDFNAILKNETVPHQKIIKNESKPSIAIEVNKILKPPAVLNNDGSVMTNDLNTILNVESLKQTVKNALKPNFAFDEKLLKPASVHLINDQTLEKKFQNEPTIISNGVNKDDKSLKGTVKKIRKPKTIKTKEVDRREKSFNCVLNKDIIRTEILTHEEQVMAMLKKKESASYKKSYYKCTDCSKGFSDEEMYALHMIRHTEQGGAYQCDICKIRFKSKHSVKSHVIFHMERYSCMKCSYVSCTRYSAKLHEAYHNGIMYQCPHCIECFQQKTSYLGHLRIKHPSSFVCDLCGFSYVSEKGIWLHKKLKHRFDEHQVVPEDGPRCTDCNIKFLNEGALAVHVKLCTKREDLTDRIRNDRQTLKNRRSNLVERRRQCRPKDPADSSNRDPSAPVTCEQCGVELPNFRVYAHHFRRAHPDMSRAKYNCTLTSSFMCEHCGKIFHCKTLLQSHMWVHTGEKPFKCERCGRTFTQKSTLTFHLRAQHSAARPIFECTLCGKHLANGGNRARHMLTHTQRTKSYICDVCGKGFTSLAQEHAHVQHVHQKKPWPKRTRARRRQRHLDGTADEAPDLGTN